MISEAAQQGSLLCFLKNGSGFHVSLTDGKSVVYTIQLCRFVTKLTLTSRPLIWNNTELKTLYVCIVLATLLLIFVTAETKAKTGSVISLDSAQTIENAKLLLIRLDEINAIDKSGLTASQTKSLRKELRVIKGELKELHKGTYMPVRKLVVLLLIPFIIFNITG